MPNETEKIKNTAIEQYRDYAIPQYAYLIIIGFLVAALALEAVGRVSLNPSGRQNFSSHILALTFPVYSVSGKVVSVGSTSFVLEVSSQNSTPSPVAASPSAAPVQQQKSFDYTVNVTSATNVSRSGGAGTPLGLGAGGANLPGQQQSKLTLQDVKINDMVTVTTASDLRTLSSDSFAAQSVTLPSLIRTLSGTISSIENNSLVVKGSVSASIGIPTTNAQQQTYTILVTKDTFISSPSTRLPVPINPANPSQPQAPASLSLSDLAKDLTVTVTFDSTKQSGNTITAISIFAFSAAPAPALAPAAASPQPLPVTPAKK